MKQLYKTAIILFILSACQNENNQSDKILNDKSPASNSIDSTNYSDYINTLPISKLPDGYLDILNNNELLIINDSLRYSKISSIEKKHYQLNYIGTHTYDICLCQSYDILESNYDNLQDTNNKYSIFKRLKPINDTIETLLLIKDTRGKIDLITINKFNEKIIDSLNLTDSYDGDYSIFKLFYISTNYKITIKSFWNYEDDGHAEPFQRSKCEYLINANGKIISYFNQPDGIVDVKLESGNDGQRIYHTLFSGEVKNHLKNGKWVEKEMVNSALNVALGEYIDGIKKGQWIYNHYYSSSINVSIDSNWKDLFPAESDTTIY
jgi:hypothetical protein